MSFVGPRALAADEQRYLEEQIPQFKERLKVKPGLTGLAQLYDHADDPHNKLKYDLEYIQRRSLWLDMNIMVLSVINTISGRWDTREGKAKQEKK